MNPGGPFTYFVLRPLSDLFLWAWRLERRLEFLYRAHFDRWLRPPLFALLQTVQNRLREDEHLALAQETPLADEERYTQEIIDEISAFTRENWLPGAAQRFGNTKTFGVLRGEFTVLPDCRSTCGRGCSPRRAGIPHGSASPGPAPSRHPTSRTWASVRWRSRSWAWTARSSCPTRSGRRT